MKSLAKLGDVCEHIVYGVTTAAVSTNAGPRLLRITDITEDGVDWRKVPGCKISNQDYESAKLLSGDIVVARTGGTVGKSFLISSPPDAVCASYLLRLRPNNKLVMPEYVQLFLQSPAYWGQLMSGARGAAQPNVNGTTLSKIAIPITDAREQERIVHDLTKQLDALRNARKGASFGLQEIKVLSRRLKQEAQTQLGTIVRVPLDDLLRNIDAGKSFQTTERLAQDNELGVLKVSAVSWSTFNPREAKGLPASCVPNDRHRVRKGDVIISRANTIELVGAVIRADRDYPQRLLSDKTLRLELDEQRCDPDFIVQVLRLPEARAHIESNATGTSDSMRNITQDTIRATPIALPGIDDQRRIAAMLRHADEAIRSAQTAMRVQLDEFAALSSRLLAQAFDN